MSTEGGVSQEETDRFLLAELSRRFAAVVDALGRDKVHAAISRQVYPEGCGGPIPAEILSSNSPLKDGDVEVAIITEALALLQPVIGRDAFRLIAADLSRIRSGSPLPSVLASGIRRAKHDKKSEDVLVATVWCYAAALHGGKKSNDPVRKEEIGRRLGLLGFKKPPQGAEEIEIAVFRGANIGVELRTWQRLKQACKSLSPMVKIVELMFQSCKPSPELMHEFFSGGGDQETLQHYLKLGDRSHEQVLAEVRGMWRRRQPRR
ncbi:hypothetical protein ACMDCR_32435 [Labrys okinawensis]|uniref:hypothetical protein n=1 Tax=Labrys okinawensis TaxID=346911 RepID=UPI0039BCAFD8